MSWVLGGDSISVGLIQSVLTHRAVARSVGTTPYQSVEAATMICSALSVDPEVSELPGCTSSARLGFLPFCYYLSSPVPCSPPPAATPEASEPHCESGRQRISPVSGKIYWNVFFLLLLSVFFSAVVGDI